MWQVYCLLDRFVRLLPGLIGHGLVELLAQQAQSQPWPGEPDLEGASQALARLQFTYRLDPASLAAGQGGCRFPVYTRPTLLVQIGDQRTSARLTPRQMGDIAASRLSGQQPLRPGLGPEFALAVLWAEAGLARVDRDMEELGRLERLLIRARHAHNTHWQGGPVTHRAHLPNEASKNYGGFKFCDDLSRSSS